ncbi:Acid phosphatase/vanadium-dependent haloperoxidase-related protein [Forsythia ovata]|uniref:Acid phosphatase/vanadium-dependent haloperoxidase-related protein n=1 Tax=Forsythia ovata TaxID=205694 RepID=A0ABD1S4L7_9LAMI
MPLESCTSSKSRNLVLRVRYHKNFALSPLIRSRAIELTRGISGNLNGWPTTLNSVARFPEPLNGVVPCKSLYKKMPNVHVLIAAALSAAIGQLTKPITSTLFYGKDFDFKAVIQAGGFPSTHSSAVMATATSLGLERGFSDAIFGLAVVYASLVMYDAQGVRREVGIHAKELNKVLLSTRTSSTSSSNDTGILTNSFSGESSSDLESIDPLFLEEQSSIQTKQANASLLLKSKNRIQSATVRSSGVEEESVSVSYGCSTLKESVGHTEIEVIAGAVLGFFVSLAICRYG